MKKLFIISGIAMIYGFAAQAQIDAGLFRYPDVSKTQIVFTYGNDIWIIPKSGGTAEKLSSPPGVESFPKPLLSVPTTMVTQMPTRYR